MKLIIIQILVAVSTVFMSCNANKNTESSSVKPLESILNNPYTDSSSEFIGITLESQATYAGVYSNLKGTKKYQVALSATVSEELVFKRLLVDSIALDIRSVMADGDRMKDNKLSKSSDLVRLTAFRKIYNTEADAPQIHDVEIYESTGLDLGKTAVIEYYKGDKPYYIEISEIIEKPGIYAP